MNRWLRVLLAVALAMLLAPPASAEIIDEVVANVNGEMISWVDITTREREIEADLKSRYSGDELAEAMRQEMETVLVDMINEKILYQRAESLGLDINMVFRRQTENFKKMNNIETNEELKQALERQGMSMDDFRKSVLRYGVPDAMISAEVRQKITIPDEEIQAYYQENLEAFAKSGHFTFREIALLMRDSDDEEDLVEKASEIAGEARSGTDFAELVKEHSEAGSKERGGLVDGLSVDDMAPTILEALNGLAPGEVSDPVVMPRAVMVLKLIEKEEANVRSLEEVRRAIESVLWRQQMKVEMDKYFRKLWEENHIKITPKYEERYATDMYR
jgi:parvulin-like peptidyl-prolyl isomerase